VLTLPDVRQKDDYDCGEAAVKCVLKYYGLSNSFKFATSQDGSDPRQLEAAFRLSGLNVIAGEMTISDLRHFARTSCPVVCLIWYPKDNTSHYVVVNGMTKTSVLYHDVAVGPSRSGVVKWRKMWTAMGRLGETFLQWGIAARLS
jgi:ABC-type bacteriocin/lantibiotic exporter with double-glycine peptidase domain